MEGVNASMNEEKTKKTVNIVKRQFKQKPQEASTSRACKGRGKSTRLSFKARYSDLSKAEYLTPEEENPFSSLSSSLSNLIDRYRRKQRYKMKEKDILIPNGHRYLRIIVKLFARPINLFTLLS
ncbi:hypothetical protein PoB_003159900 [Plakobranchus ocellatus]|uniref:Uncharacterized protein n=1 Tax=Plakobranchus ocellatus TaxID=259542 RepID=A0AAV4AF94_9GAST|nr:hypothetical protein PoB_003159900 [Plakobranchus ocellatus]